MLPSTDTSYWKRVSENQMQKRIIFCRIPAPTLQSKVQKGEFESEGKQLNSQNQPV